MKRMKMLVWMLPMALITLGSCKKKIWGCMDETALNYSPVATEDAQDCIYEEVLISNVISNVSWDQSGEAWGLTLTWDEITQDVLDNGSVDVYMRVTGQSEWFPLPYSIPSGYENVTDSYYVVYLLGTIDVWCEADDNILPDPQPNCDFKIVIQQ
jgi:hypothetical protein